MDSKILSINDYYLQRFVAFQIVQSVKDREVACIGESGTSRGARIETIEYFSNVKEEEHKSYLDWINWKTKHQKLYRSVAKFSEIPTFSLDARKRSKGEEGTLAWFQSKKFYDSIYEYDLFMDFDKLDSDKDLNNTLKEVKIIINIFKTFKLPFYVIFSGNKGFQVIIDGKYLPKHKIIGEAVYPHKIIVEMIKSKFKLERLDLSNNGVPNKLCKIPYSLIGENVALPLDDKQIENFNVLDMNFRNVWKNIIIYNRGLLERYGTKENVDKFINMIGVKLE
jgi:hypothetical protein